MKIYDAEGQIVGRLCSVVAKKLIEGESIAVVNAEKAVLSGGKKYTISHYSQRTKRGDPIKGPFSPKVPDGIFRRAVRGMLPMDKERGRKAFKGLRVYIGVPDELKGRSDKFEKADAADASKIKTKTLTLGELSVAIGAKKRW